MSLENYLNIQRRWIRKVGDPANPTFAIVLNGFNTLALIPLYYPF